MSACWPSAIVRGVSIRTRSPAASDRRVSSPASGSTPTTRTPGRSAFAAVAQPAISPPPPTGTSRRSRSGTSSRSSSAAVPWPAITAGCSYGGTSVEAALPGQRRAERLAVLGVAVIGHDLGAVAPGRLELGHGRVGGHEDRRARPEHAGGDRDGLGVVARRVGDDAAAAGVLRQRRDHAVGAAELERSAALQALRLQVHARAGPGVEGARPQHRRAVGDAVQAGGGRVDVVERDHA